MSKIAVLPQDVISKVAAGEVVERPASVVKELIENSIDAGARTIRIELEDAGFKSIKVTDDGEGMSREDLLLSFLPHSTSKIRSVEDIASIRSLGFRGEALASISAVSHFSIRSCVRNAPSGSEITLEPGSSPKERNLAMLPGTTVTVSALFYNVPARAKFLKTHTVEYSLILSIFTAYVLSRESLGWELYRNGKPVFKIMPDATKEHRVRMLLGADLLSNLVPIHTQNEHVTLTGFISKPQASVYNKDTQFLFINGRAVSSPTVSNAVKDAYGTLLEERTFSPFVIYMTLRPDLVDVNVHPRKELVSFWNDSIIYDFIRDAVKACLDTHDLTYIQSPEQTVLNEGASQYTFKSLKELVEPWNVKGISSEEFTEILQIGNTYLVSPVKQGFLVVDQHAAHESILFEEYSRAFIQERSRNEKVTLEPAVTFDLPVSDSELIKENFVIFNDIGFSLEEFGQNTFKLNSFPKLLKDHDPVSLVKETLADLKTFGKARPLDVRSQHTVEFLACRGAIKAGEKLTMEERRNLLKKLATSKGLYTCPHGRPVSVIMSLHDLDRLFKRV